MSGIGRVVPRHPVRVGHELGLGVRTAEDVRRRARVVHSAGQDLVRGEQDVAAAGALGCAAASRGPAARRRSLPRPRIHASLPRLASVTSIGARSTLEASCWRGIAALRVAAARVHDDQRDADRLVVGRADLAREQPVRARVLAVVGGEHEDRVAELRLGDRRDDIADRGRRPSSGPGCTCPPALPVAVGRDGEPEGVAGSDGEGCTREPGDARVVGAAAPDQLLEGPETCWVTGLLCRPGRRSDSQLAGTAGNPAAAGSSSRGC